MASDEFTLFPKLPIEIRLKIWFHALPGPRMIDTNPVSRYYLTRYGKYPKNPKATSTCRESREVALKHYQKLNQGGYIKWVDFKVDYFVCKNHSQNQSVLSDADWASIHNIIFDSRDFVGTINTPCVMQHLHQTGYCGGIPHQLNKVVILTGPYEDGSRLDIEFEVRKLRLIKKVIEDKNRKHCTMAHGLSSSSRGTKSLSVSTGFPIGGKTDLGFVAKPSRVIHIRLFALPMPPKRSST